MQQSLTNKISFLLPHTLTLLLLIGYCAESPYLFLALFFLYLTTLTCMDFFIKRDQATNYTIVANLSANEGIGIRTFYRFALYSFILLYFILLFTGIYFAQFKPNTIAWLLYALPVGVISGIILNVCHELMHTKYKSEKILARIVACFSFWGVHEFEHLFFHHNNEFICTEADKSYAKLNQSIYSFMLNAFIGNYQHAWKVQQKNSARKNTWFYNIFHNLLLQIYLFSLVIFITTWALTGIYGCLFLLLQGIVGFTLFLATTYNQHYGLTRRKNSEGVYESFTFMNVWSSDFCITSKLYFNVTHHAHHHKHQFCHYEFLEIIDKNPLLPYNYNTMLALSFIPPIWYKIMNKRVEKVLELRDQYAQEGMML